MPAGAPPKYKKEFCEEVIELGKLGNSITQIACKLNVAKQSLYNWMDQHPEFLDAMTRAREYSQAWFEDKGMEGLTTPGFNASLWAKQVSCRYPDDYRETTRTEQQQLDSKGNPTDPVTTITLNHVKPTD